MPPDWHDSNSSYLAAGLAWLREQLDRAEAEDSGRAQGLPPGWWESAEWSGLPGPPPALEILTATLALSRFEALLLLLGAAMEFDTALPASCARANGNPVLDYPTFALALRILPEPTWDVVSPHRPLRYWRLLEIHQPPGEPLITSQLRADPRVVNYLKGLNDLDERLAAYFEPVPDAFGGCVPESHAQTIAAVNRVWTGSHDPTRVPVVQLVGPDPLVRRGLAKEASARVGLDLFELDLGRIIGSPPDVTDLIRLWERETLLRSVSAYIDVGDRRPDDHAAVAAVLRGIRGVVIVGGREPWPLDHRPVRVIDALRPTASEQEQLWIDALGPGAEGTAAQLAGQFNLNQAAISDVAHETGSEEPAELWRACRALTRSRLDGLAQRIEPIATWEDLVLPPTQLAVLRDLVDQVRGRTKVLRHWGFADRILRGAGHSALFAGPSGTGKTLAAEVIAAELGVTLYRVDLSGVISKYIGETERNLRQVFDGAEESGALLFFDEADALFGKRSQVKDSHDRYANIEVSYLLQRMEDYRGVAILATNQRNALDHAFLRRLRMVVKFPHPGEEERSALWHRAFTVHTPTAGIDIDHLARLPATGGMIRNIALNAASCAAARDTPVTMELVLDMARLEFQKLDLPVSERDLRPDGVVAR